MWLHNSERLAPEGGGTKRTEGVHVVGMACTSNDVGLPREGDFKRNLSSRTKVPLFILYTYIYIGEVVVGRGEAGTICLQHDAGGLESRDKLDGLYLLLLTLRHSLRFQRTWLIGHDEGGCVILGVSVFLPNDGVVDKQLYTGRTAIDVDTKGIAAMSVNIVLQTAHDIDGLIVFWTEFHRQIFSFHISLSMPVPMVLFGSPSPSVHIFSLTIGKRRTHSHCDRAATPKDITIVTGSFLVANQIKVTAVGVEPRP